jgi:hypothetical protein
MSLLAEWNAPSGHWPVLIIREAVFNASASTTQTENLLVVHPVIDATFYENYPCISIGFASLLKHHGI